MNKKHSILRPVRKSRFDRNSQPSLGSGLYCEDRSLEWTDKHLSHDFVTIYAPWAHLSLTALMQAKYEDNVDKLCTYKGKKEVYLSIKFVL